MHRDSYRRTIKRIIVVQENQKLFENHALIYDVWLTRGIIFDFGNHQVSFEKGAWLSEQIIIRKGYDLLSEFTPKANRLESNGWLYRILDSDKETVCISVRRGDYISDEKVGEQFYVCSRTYYESAIQYSCKRISNPVFIVFSDDIEWCKRNISFFECEHYFESGQDPGWEKLRLMYSCKHFIISNSTFSWWAQYLSRNENKIIVSPDRWFAKGGNEYPLLLDSFNRIAT